MTKDLKPCPLCGNLLEIVRKNGSKYMRCISGVCIFETARHGHHISDDELIKRCNRRPAEDAKDAEIARLKKINDKLFGILKLARYEFEIIANYCEENNMPDDERSYNNLAAYIQGVLAETKGEKER